MLVRYHMTREVRTFAPSTRALDALAQMRDLRIRFAPVVENGELVGVVTERDLLRKLPGSAAEEERRAGALILVSHAMSREIVSIGENEHIEAAARMMFEHKFSGLPVVEHDRLIGVLTTGDLLHTLMQNEAAKEGHRLTILLPSFGPGMDLAQLCIDAGLRVNSLLSHRVRAGAFLASVRVTGPWEAVEALLVRLRRDGAILVEGADLRETA